MDSADAAEFKSENPVFETTSSHTEDLLYDDDTEEDEEEQE